RPAVPGRVPGPVLVAGGAPPGAVLYRLFPVPAGAARRAVEVHPRGGDPALAPVRRGGRPGRVARPSRRLPGSGYAVPGAPVLLGHGAKGPDPAAVAREKVTAQRRCPLIAFRAMRLGRRPNRTTG